MERLSETARNEKEERSEEMRKFSVQIVICHMRGCKFLARLGAVRD